METQPIHLIINPASGTRAARDRLYALVEAMPELRWELSESPEHLEALVRETAERDGSILAVAGGDGTVNAAANALLNAGGGPALGIVPLGSGNDLARTLGIPLDAETALNALMHARRKPMDVMAVRIGDETEYALNMVSGGYGGDVAHAVDEDLKDIWGPVAYLMGAVRLLPETERYRVTLCCDGGDDVGVPAMNVFVANGRSMAGGHCIAPEASPCDGWLDVVTVDWTSLGAMAELSALFLAGRLLESPLVFHRRVREVAIEAEPPMRFNVDGEPRGTGAASVAIRPGALQVVVGPDFDAAA